MRNLKKGLKWIIIKTTFPFIPVDDKKIFIESFFGNKMDGNPFYLMQYIYDMEEFRDYTFIIVDNNDISPFKNAISVKKFSFNYMKHLYTSKYVISNLRIGPRFKKKKKQVYVQTWHGTPLKRLVHDMVSHQLSLNPEKYLANFDRDVAKWDYLLTPNDYSTEKLRSAFQYEGEMIEGYPRNYPLTLKYAISDIDNLKRKIGIKNLNKKVYLYTPTFRDTEKTKSHQYSISLQLDLDFLNEQKDKIFLIRAHYLISNNLNLDKYCNIIDVSHYDKINELFLVSDVLINDYSSTMFDYGYLNKPVILYPYDLESYSNDIRGFYLDYSTLSNNICYDLISLNNVIINGTEEKLLINFTPEINMNSIVDKIFSN